nr:MAG: hypothetical protein DIU78_16400 [Pseudomonadota bacterium]
MATSSSSRVPIGTILQGKFRLSREIGRGGMAAVYEAENIDIGKRVAVKILAAELITSRVVRERFLREARAAAAVRSPYICDVYDSGMYEDRPFLVMELLEGESLYDMMTRVRKLDVETTLRIATHTARALARAHESNIVHRDLKPENIFLTRDEEGALLAKILDFGLAKFYEPTGADARSARLTREGALFGTPAYMSPEQAKGQGEVDHRADLWALGCIVYECLTGRTVWNIEQGVAMILAQIAGAPLPQPSKFRPDLPPSFDQWFYRALHRDPTCRYQTAREFADALAEALLANPAATLPATPPSAPEVPGLSSPVAALSSPVASETAPSASAPSDGAPPVESASSSSHPDPRGPAAISVEPGTSPASSSRAISFLLLAAALALGSYAFWLYFLHPPTEDAPLTLASSASATAPPVRPSADPNAIGDFESAPYALKVAEGQELLATDGKKALEAFQEAFRQGSEPVARSLLSHATVAVDEAGAGCRVTGIARPRPFQLDGPASRPTIASTDKGTIVAWADTHQDPRRRQAFTVLLDSAMRRISAPVPVTPEAHTVREPKLVPAQGRLALVYWDEGGKEPGLYARFITAEGKIQSPARQIAASRTGANPALAPAPNGEFWAVWEEPFDGANDIVARRLGPELDPRGPVVRLTRLRRPKSGPFPPRTPDAVVAHDRLYVAFAKDLGGQKLQIMIQSIALTDSKLATGLPEKRRGRRQDDEFVGTLRPVSSGTSKNTEPRLACFDEGCFVVWDDEKAGAVAAFVDRERGPLWHREFSHKGNRPAVASAPGGGLVTWYEGSRLRFAKLTRDGVGEPSALTRVSGIQPNPDVARGEKPGEWYIAFRDYEAAHLEVFALRAEGP